MMVRVVVNDSDNDSELCSLLEKETDQMRRSEAFDVYRNLFREELARRRR